MEMMNKLLVLCSLSLLVSPCFGKSFTTVKWGEWEYNGRQYSITATVTNLDIDFAGSEAWWNCSATCRVYLRDVNWSAVTTIQSVYEPSKRLTDKQLSARLRQELLPWTVRYSTPNLPTCMEVGMSSDTSTNGSQSLSNSCRSGEMTPPPKPTPPTSCSFMENTLELNFGPLQMDEVSGREKSAPITLLCTGNANTKITIKADSGNKVMLDRNANFYASLWVNKRDASNGIVVDAFQNIPKQVDVSATLAGTALNAGAFSGSAVIRVDVL